MHSDPMESNSACVLASSQRMSVERSPGGSRSGALGTPSSPLGRKLEFLVQELMRETNTMANKTHDSDLIQTILAIKVHVEQLREQIANLE